MDSSAARLEPADPEPATQLIHPHPDAANTHARPVRLVWLSAVVYATSVVRDDHVQLRSNSAELNGSFGSRCVTVDVGQSLLDDAENGPLHPHRELVVIAPERA